MPVSKKRKKAGNPVHRHDLPNPEGGEHAHGPEAKIAAPVQKPSKPSNPFTAQRQLVRSAQRGR
jgi:hypothetical protein